MTARVSVPTMVYFAYGSNMSGRRLRSRVPNARTLGLAVLERHQLRFRKHGGDGSAKCDVEWTDRVADGVHGVLYEIGESEKLGLDRVEGVGHGYRDAVVVVRRDGLPPVRAFTYLATALAPGLAPYTWYLQHVLAGAQEAGLPPAYIAMIAATHATDDPDRSRSARELGLYRRDAGAPASAPLARRAG